jgi:hypothetical protein
VRRNPDVENSPSRAFLTPSGEAFGFAKDGSLVIPREIAQDLSLALMNRAIRGFQALHLPYFEEWVFVTEDKQFGDDPDMASRDLWLGWDDAELSATAGFVVGPYSEAPPNHVLRGILGPLLKRHRASFEGRWTDRDDHFTSVGVACTLSGRARTVGELADLARDMQALFDVLDGGTTLSREMCLDLLKAGRADVLIGQQESEWLDAKREPYRLKDDREKWELAKDVASFANSPYGGLIAIGLGTSQSVTGERITSLSTFRLHRQIAQSSLAVIRDRITPIIQGVEFGAHEVENGVGYAWIHIPPQPNELEPFIVRGTVRDGKMMGTHLTIPYRTGDVTEYLDAAAVHSFLAAGRIALRS